MDEFRQARAVISIVCPQPGQSTQTSTPCPGIENSNGSLHLGQVRTAGLGGWYSCVMLARYSAIGSSGTAAVPWSTVSGSRSRQGAHLPSILWPGAEPVRFVRRQQVEKIPLELRGSVAVLGEQLGGMGVRCSVNTEHRILASSTS
jgi:hypothetical protein